MKVNRKIAALVSLVFCFVLSNGCREEKIVLQKVDNKFGSKLFAVSRIPTPVLNTQYFDSIYGGKDGRTLKKSSSGLVKELEYVAYPGTSFEILNIINKGNHSIYRVYAEDYSIPELKIELYIDSRFTDTTRIKPSPRKVDLPSKSEIINYMKTNTGSLYVWGGNNVEGVPEMFEFYPPSGKLDEKERKEWGLKGVDCSGLIYQATNGFTPRNTHQMVTYGEAVEIEGLSSDEIAKKLLPLDLIVWKGHVIIVIDNGITIQSAHSSWGVVQKGLKEVLKSLMAKRTALNAWNDDESKKFVIRRWYKEKN